jgi:hypothetical protein
MEFAYGKDCPALADKRVAAAQVRLRDLQIQNRPPTSKIMWSSGF